MEVQMLLDGSWEMLQVTKIREIMRRCQSTTSRGKQKEFLLPELCQPTHAFLLNAAHAMTYEMMLESFRSWLGCIPILESICRASRPSATGDDRGWLDLDVAEWYEDYLATAYVSALRRRAHGHYCGCVLCGESSESLNLHHRHYRTLGAETLTDLSVLCDNCHQKSHRFLGLRVPMEPPTAVLDILRQEYDSWKTK